MVVPLAANSQSVPIGCSAPSRTDTVVPTASAICEASVRCQIMRYSDSSWPFSSAASASGLRSGVVGRMASWASCAFLTLLVNCRGAGRQELLAVAPLAPRPAPRPSASALSTTLSVRM